MVNNLSPKRVSYSLASLLVIFYLICVILFAIAPVSTLNIFKNIFHGIDISQIASTTTTFGSILAGFVAIIIISLVAGWLFAVIYNYFAKTK